MSSLYDIEPQPTAKLVLQTTAGDILLELFAKQTPVTCRNFLQLCLDGYYDNTIFHRLVADFVIQGGDPTGTGEGGESIYDGGLFADEFHSRLKFNRRGLLGMANSGKKNDNGSQFFLTLGKTEELNGRNTMFGRVAGDTIYNLMKMGEAEVVEDGSERPLYPTKVTGAEILVNPFEDMQRKERVVRPVIEKAEVKKKPPKKKGGKALLSFGDEEGDDGDAAPVAKKAKFNPKLFGDEKPPESKPDLDVVEEATKTKTPTEKPLRKKRASRSPPSSPELVTAPPTQTLPTRSSAPRPQSVSSSASSTPEPAPSASQRALSRTNAEIASLKASMRRSTHQTSDPSASTAKKPALEQMIPATSIRGRKRKQGRDAGSDQESMNMLNAFRAKLDSLAPSALPDRSTQLPATNGAGPPPSADATADQEQNEQAHADDEEAPLCDLHFIANCQSCGVWDAEQREQHTGKNGHSREEDIDAGAEDESWLAHTLSFEKDRLGKDLTWKRKNEEELVVIDPREKGKGIREDKRRDRGKDKAWDRGKR